MGPKFKSLSSSWLNYNSIAALLLDGLNLDLGLKGLGSNILLSYQCDSATEASTFYQIFPNPLLKLICL